MVLAAALLAGCGGAKSGGTTDAGAGEQKTEEQKTEDREGETADDSDAAVDTGLSGQKLVVGTKR